MDVHIRRIATEPGITPESVSVRPPEVRVPDDIRRRLPTLAGALDEFNVALSEQFTLLASKISKR